MSTMIQSNNLMEIPSNFPLINGKELGKMHLCEFGTGPDGVNRSCLKSEVKAGFVWTQCMPADKGGPMPEGVTSCPKTHFGYLESGKMKITMVETGEVKIISTGDAYFIGPNHDAEMTEDTALIEFESKAAEFYGKL
jgi:hypothetical protein